MTASVQVGRVRDGARVFGTLALVVALLLAPLINSLTHGPATFAQSEQTVTEDRAHGHSHDADAPAGHHDSTDHDHPTVALVPPQPPTAPQRLPKLPRPSPQLSDGRERGDLLRPPRALA